MSQPLNWWTDYYTSMLWQGNFNTKEDIQAMLFHLIEEAQSDFNVEQSTIGKA